MFEVVHNVSLTAWKVNDIERSSGSAKVLGVL